MKNIAKVFHQATVSNAIKCGIYINIHMVSAQNVLKTVNPFEICHSALKAKKSLMCLKLCSLHTTSSTSNYQHQHCHRPTGLLLFWACSRRKFLTEGGFWGNKSYKVNKRCEVARVKAVGGSLRQPVLMLPQKPRVEVIVLSRVTAVPLCCLMMETDCSGQVSQAPTFILTRNGPPGSCCADGWLGKTFCDFLYFCARRRWPTFGPHNKALLFFFLAKYLSSFCFMNDAQVSQAFIRWI